MIKRSTVTVRSNAELVALHAEYDRVGLVDGQRTPAMLVQHWMANAGFVGYINGKYNLDVVVPERVDMVDRSHLDAVRPIVDAARRLKAANDAMNEGGAWAEDWEDAEIELYKAVREAT